MSDSSEGVDKSHFEGFEIQPHEFIKANNIGFLEGCIITTICRFNLEGGTNREYLEDIKNQVENMLSLSAKQESLVDSVTRAMDDSSDN